jgi:hypothetical protein
MHQVPAARAGELAAMTPAAVERVYRDIELKRRVAARLDGPALVVDGEAPALLEGKDTHA